MKRQNNKKENTKAKEKECKKKEETEDFKKWNKI